MINIVFFGTPDFAIPFLSALIENPEINVKALICQPDKPVGREATIMPPATKVLAQAKGIEVFQPASLKNNDAIVQIASYEADLFVVVAYGKIIPQAILDLPAHGTLNVHPSLLPEYRGPSPMQAAVAHGDDQTGITIMLLDAGMDTGPILAQDTILLDADETYESLQDKVHARGPGLLLNTIERYLAKEITPVPQDETKATITSLLKRDDGRIDWTAPLVQIERKIRAYQPWPGTWTTWNDKRLKIFKAEPSDFFADVPPGTVTVKDDQLFVDCADGTLEIKNLQLEGKPAMSAKEFVTGHAEIAGSKLPS